VENHLLNTIFDGYFAHFKTLNGITLVTNNFTTCSLPNNYSMKITSLVVTSKHLSCFPYVASPIATIVPKVVS
jgi:hypothetical protein